MKAVATFHAPTSVSHTIKCSLTSEEDFEYLIVAKTCILEVYAILLEELALQCSLEVWGCVTSLQAVPVGDSPKQHLLLTTDHPDPKLLLFEYVNNSGRPGGALICIKELSLFERGARPAEFFIGSLVDRKGKVAVVSSYVGKLKVVQLEDGNVHSEFDVSIRELNIISMCFLLTWNSRSTTLAILHRDHTQKLFLVSHDLSAPERELSSSPSTLLSDAAVVDDGSCSLVPVPPHGRGAWNAYGGVLVLGGSRILFYSIDRKQKKSNEKTARSWKAETTWPFSDISVWAQVDPEGTRYLLGDTFGRLALLAFDTRPQGLSLLALGEVSPPTSLSPLSSQYFFVGSHYGDSQLVRIVPDKSSTNGTYLETMETFKNIAPVSDAIIADTDDSGQPVIVACSGGKSTGSLRIIRHGANFAVDAQVDSMPNVTEMWPLKAHFNDEYHSFLLLSTPLSTQLLQFSSSPKERAVTRVADLYDLRSDTATLAAGNVMVRRKSPVGDASYESGSLVVQVTSDAVRLLNIDFGVSKSQWSPERGKEIILADISPSQVCIALSGGEVVLLQILEDGIREQSRKVFIEHSGRVPEVSALSFSSPKPGMAFAKFVVLGFWHTHEVKALTLPSFEPTDNPLRMSDLPKALLLCDFGTPTDPHPHLLVGLVDGTVSAFPFKTGKFGERKAVSLGESPISLNFCCVKGQPAVVASGTRSALFSWGVGSLDVSPVLLKDVSTASALSTLAFPTSLVLASPVGLIIGRILELDKLHIRTVAMGHDSPIRIAYHAPGKVFGVGCLNLDLYDANIPERITSTFKLLKATTFAPLHEFALDANEEVTAVTTIDLEWQDNKGTYFVIGSMFYDDSEREPSRGRILVFSPGQNMGSASSDQFMLPHLVATGEAKGCVYAISGVKGKVVAAINTSVVLFELQLPSTGHGAANLVRLSEWNHNYLVTSIISRGDRIITGDALQGTSALWPLCIELFDDTAIIGADSDNNLFSFKLRRESDKVLLDRDGSYHINETVNKFVPGYLSTPNDKLAFIPKQLFFTATGRIGVLIDVDNVMVNQLSCLQRNMADVIKGPGKTDHTLWRAPVSSSGRSDVQMASIGFLDADMLEHFLDYQPSSVEVQRIMAGTNEAERLNLSYEQIRSALEALRSVH